MSLLQKLKSTRRSSSIHRSQSISSPLSSPPVVKVSTTEPHQISSQPSTLPKMSAFKKLHIPFWHNNAKTAPVKDQALVAAEEELKAASTISPSLPSIKRNQKTLSILRTDVGRRTNTIWSETVDEDLIQHLSSMEQNRQEVLFEIIQTESEYVRDLKLIEQVFIRPIKAAEAKYPHKNIIPPNLNKVFNSISYFLFIHEVISNCLNERQEHQSPLVRSISDILLAYVWIFRAYAPYLIHYEEALSELNDCLRHKTTLGKIVKKQQKVASCRNMPLTTYLLKPFQRLLQYPLLVRNLLKYTIREVGSDYENLITLRTKLETVLRDIEEQKRAHENKERLRALEARIQGLSGFRLAVDNRLLIREEPACQNSVSLEKQPSLRRSLTVTSSPSTNLKRHSVRNLYTLECNDIVLLVEKTGETRDGEAIYRLLSRPPTTPLDEEPVIIHKPQDSGIFYDDDE
ncbi:hypothetical protein G9A89_020240 [Geosiphon pyriformis]|nr:hypothetical protein G9A89_020240 [Geosiphon pyriformis]